MMMKGGIRVGRLLGINLTIDPSWIFVFLLTMYGLTTYFLEIHPNWKVEGAALVALVAALLFFASIVAHEYGHALVAKTFGLPVREIRLFLFGGVSNIETEPPSPRAEFLIAIVGPLVSFALGASMLMVATMVLYADPSAARFDLQETTRRLGPVMTVLLWLGPLNITVGVFNLIPGFPLDGGRVLRAVLWKTTGNLRRATHRAALIGQATGWTFILIGIAMFFGARVPFFGHGTGSGLWLAFIGWFLRGAAQSGYRALVIQEILGNATVADVMRRTPPVLPLRSALPTPTIAEAVRTWIASAPAEHTLGVVVGSKLIGMVSKSDLRRAPQNDWNTTPLSTIMTPDDRLVITLPTERAIEALKTLASAEVRQLPVVDTNGNLIGMFDGPTTSSWIEMNLSVPRNAEGRSRSAMSPPLNQV